MSIFFQRMGLFYPPIVFDSDGREWDADTSARTGGNVFHYAGKLAEGTLYSSPEYSGGIVTINGQPLGGYDFINVNGPITLDQSTADSWSSVTADSRSMWICVNGDLEIPSGVTLTPGVRKLYMVLFVTGDLIIDGVVSMSQRGADHSSATGSNITAYAIKIDDTWSIGSSSVNGAARRSTNGSNDGGNATGDNTGGGGSGARIWGTAGGGAHGTCFSGGPGGGTSSINPTGDGEDGAIHGGKGGDGDGSGSWAGGAGNPGGDGNSNGDDGDPGTGGTVVILCQGELSGSGSVSASGARGGDATSTVGGGGSGGGSAHVLYGTDVSTITITATKGLGGTGNTYNGGDGGDGTARDTTIQDPPPLINPTTTPVTEVITIPGGHNNAEFDILTIGGFPIEDFNSIQVVATDILTTGSGSTIKLGFRISTNGGAFWISGTNYRTIRTDQSSTNIVNTSLMICHEGPGPWNFGAWLENVNSDVPTVLTAQQITSGDTSPDRNGCMTAGSALSHNALQLVVISTSSIKINGGTLSITGYR